MHSNNVVISVDMGIQFLDKPIDLADANNKEDRISSSTIVKSEFTTMNLTGFHHNTTMECFEDELKGLSMMTTTSFLDPFQSCK